MAPSAAPCPKPCGLARAWERAGGIWQQKLLDVRKGFCGLLKEICLSGGMMRALCFSEVLGPFQDLALLEHA